MCTVYMVLLCNTDCWKDDRDDGGTLRSGYSRGLQFAGGALGGTYYNFIALLHIIL